MEFSQTNGPTRVEIIRRIRRGILEPLVETARQAEASGGPEDAGLSASLTSLYQRARGSFENAERLAGIETLDAAWSGWEVLLEGFRRRSGGFEMTRLGEVPEPGAVAVRQIDLAVREALVNAMRHAHASRIEVMMVPWKDGLALTITDDGRGMPERVLRGVGMNSMSRRMALAGGEILVHSAGGTTIEFRIPGRFSEEVEDSGCGFASYLHDELGQDLIAEAMRWELARDAAESFKRKAYYDQFQSLLRGIAMKARTLSHELEDCG